MSMSSSSKRVFNRLREELITILDGNMSEMSDTLYLNCQIL